MNKTILNFINKCEKWKVEIKENHWAANSLSQHELCDDIASEISDFEDLVSEVEQSISGKIKNGELKPDKAERIELKPFVEEIISSSQAFLKELDGMGEKYIGIKSECEAFIGVMQRKLYLVNFTLKEELKNRLKERINESMPKNLSRHDEVDKFMGRKPKSIKARINQIYRIVKKYGIDSKVYHDENWQAISDYYRAISSLGCEVDMKPCGHISNIDSMQSDGGYCDYAEDGMPRSKQYAVKIMFEDGMNIDGYIKCMAAGTVSDPFSRYDTCIVLWPKNSRTLKGEGVVEDGVNEYGDTQQTRSMMGAAAKRGIMNGKTDVYHNAMNSLGKRMSSKDEYGDFQKGFEMEGKEIKLSESELKQVIKEAATKILSETPLNYDIDNFSGRWTKPSNGYDLTSGEEYIDDEGYLDGPYKHDEIENALADDEWEWGKDMDMKGAENEYSWDRFEHKPIAQGLDPYYSVGKRAVPREVDNAIDMRNRKNDWRDNELRHGRRMMDKWVNGQRDNEDLEDGWDDLKYMNRFEGKEPMKVTEEELKTIVKEAATKLIQEYGENVTNYIRRTHGAGRLKTGDPRKDKENREKYYARQCEKQRKQLKKISKGTDESIEIDPKNKGKFTATKKATGKSTEELTHSKNPLTRKRAIFAQNAKRWSKK